MTNLNYDQLNCLIVRTAAAHRATGGRTAAARRSGMRAPLARHVDEQVALVGAADAYVAAREGRSDVGVEWADDETAHRMVNGALAAQSRAERSPMFAVTGERRGESAVHGDVDELVGSLAAPTDLEAACEEAGEELIAATRLLPYRDRVTLAQLREGVRPSVSTSEWSRRVCSAREQLAMALDDRRCARRAARRAAR